MVETHACCIFAYRGEGSNDWTTHVHVVDVAGARPLATPARAHVMNPVVKQEIVHASGKGKGAVKPLVKPEGQTAVPANPPTSFTPVKSPEPKKPKAVPATLARKVSGPVPPTSSPLGCLKRSLAGELDAANGTPVELDSQPAEGSSVSRLICNCMCEDSLLFI